MLSVLWPLIFFTVCLGTRMRFMLRTAVLRKLWNKRCTDFQLCYTPSSIPCKSPNRMATLLIPQHTVKDPGSIFALGACPQAIIMANSSAKINTRPFLSSGNSRRQSEHVPRTSIRVAQFYCVATRCQAKRAKSLRLPGKQLTIRQTPGQVGSRCGNRRAEESLFPAAFTIRRGLSPSPNSVPRSHHIVRRGRSAAFGPHRVRVAPPIL